jgi:hypothetical protein
MLDTDTKRRIDTARDILVGKVPDPKSQVEQITIALIYKFMDDMDAENEGTAATTTWPMIARGEVTKRISGGTPSKENDSFWRGTMPKQRLKPAPPHNRNVTHLSDEPSFPFLKPWDFRPFPCLLAQPSFIKNSRFPAPHPHSSNFALQSFKPLPFQHLPAPFE